MLLSKLKIALAIVALSALVGGGAGSLPWWSAAAAQDASGKESAPSRKTVKDLTDPKHILNLNEDQIDEWVVGAGHDARGKGQRRERDGREATHFFGRATARLDVGGRHQECAAHLPGGVASELSKVRHERTGQAVRDQHDPALRFDDRAFQVGEPIGELGLVPVGLFDAAVAVRSLPQRLPVTGTGVSEAGQNQDQGLGHRI